MPKITDIYLPPQELVLGLEGHLNSRVPEADQKRQRSEVLEILQRLRNQPGIILADEVGMGKTFVALGIAYNVAVKSPLGPVIVMVPSNLTQKWEQDLKTFCELYLKNRIPVNKLEAEQKELRNASAVRYGIAHHSIELMKFLDDPPKERCHLIFLAHGAMSRGQTDKWVRLALIAECLRRHARGGASHLIQVKQQIHRFVAELIWAIGEERATDWGEDLWQKLMGTAPSAWKEIYNSKVKDAERKLVDDPVPKAVVRALGRLDLKKLTEALEKIPVRARGGEERVSERLKDARDALRYIERDLWSVLLHQARWRSPMLVMDEAHHLKNPETSLARQLQSAESQEDLCVGDGAMSQAFDRMLFLTATPFQLGHHELARVLERFGDVRWDDGALGNKEDLTKRLHDLSENLTQCQRSAIALQRSWSRLKPEDCGNDIEAWWKDLQKAPSAIQNHHHRAVLEAYNVAKQYRESAEKLLRPWIVRFNKGDYWVGTDIMRRQRLNGAAVLGTDSPGGLPVPPEQLLPFFLAARSAVKPGQDLLGEALCSSYEAFRFTRQNNDAGKDEQEQEQTPDAIVNLSHADWYLTEFDRALKQCSGYNHPKVNATVRRVVDLWENGEKVLVFAFYRHTCRSLRKHISTEIEKRTLSLAQYRLQKAGKPCSQEDVEKIIDRIQNRFFDDTKSPGRRAIDNALSDILTIYKVSLDKVNVPEAQRISMIEVMRRFLRVPTTLVRCFPIGEFDAVSPAEAVRRTFSCTDNSNVSWRDKFCNFICFLTEQCSTVDEREVYLDAAQRTETGTIRVGSDEDDVPGAEKKRSAVPNVQVAMGSTPRDARARLMRAFNTPFFPDILVCSKVMGEGVDLQRYCRHVIHHDLDWNPCSIEQRTGRVDRLGCKAEGRYPIQVYLPYLAGTADERQYKVMSDREQWFRVVMGQNEVAKLITAESTMAIPLPQKISEGLSFKLDFNN